MLKENKLSISLGVLLLILALGALYVWFELKPEWEDAIRIEASKKAVKEVEEAAAISLKELDDQWQEKEKIWQEKEKRYQVDLSIHARRNSKLKEELADAIEEGKRNQKLLTQLSGYALFERIISRTNELWKKHNLQLPE